MILSKCVTRKCPLPSPHSKSSYTFNKTIYLSTLMPQGGQELDSNRCLLFSEVVVVFEWKKFPEEEDVVAADDAVDVVGLAGVVAVASVIVKSP